MRLGFQSRMRACAGGRGVERGTPRPSWSHAADRRSESLSGARSRGLTPALYAVTPARPGLSAQWLKERDGTLIGGKRGWGGAGV